MIDPDLTNRFFLESESDQLTRIYQWARARYAAPWAVFGAVLLRVAASTGPHVQLPGVIGGRASLNMMAVFVAASGGGKGISDATARLAWPADIHEEGLGSGQGISELFKETKNPEDRISRAIFMVPEIDHLAALDAGQGNNTRATLKAAIMGERLGSKGASSATSRMVAPHTYRMCLSVAGQFGHCGVILDDATGGTPQRTLWFPSTDPQMPDERSADPGPLDTGIPLWAPGADGVVEIAYGPAEITETIIAAHLARQRGDGDALDGHAMLVRCKVAALLAIMHHRSVVSEQDWALSEAVMQVSDATRNVVLEHDRRAARAKIRERAISRAVGEEVIDDRRLAVVKRRVIKVLTNGRTARRDLMSRMGKREYRELLDSAIAELAADCSLSAVAAPQGGTHYELTPEFTAEPQFSTQNARSEALTPEFTAEPSATVTNLDSRRSTCSECHQHPARTDTGKCSACTLATVEAHTFMVCWFRANSQPGHWVKPAVVIAAGTDIGYKHATLKAAQQRGGNPRIESSGAGRGSMWRLAVDDEVTA
ncbi:hypothetical protein [Mycolicibacter virginiensis]|uniref:hypothetical protein n=1 Tax=Mycolicibacter virginiensis TaxID=1795032 RepID=UPI001FEFE168|nr:hypothetical protein [Mycolicibacter virginiensis]ULP47338.1 hypothetical protein MJO54_21730 [Mycolicibacter virginiensis]